MQQQSNDDVSTNQSQAAKRHKAQVKLLMKKPQPVQRSEEWFKQRQTRVTASEAASCLTKSEAVCGPYARAFGLTNFKYKDRDCLNPYENTSDYIIKKVSAFYGESTFKDTVFTLWGKKYEEVANRLYGKITGKKVHEFGLISHSRLKWLAASPDGITEEGVMLEIKCPKSRKIDSAVPIYYWVQCQIQLEVCNLEKCDFLECEITEVADEAVFRDLKPGEKTDIGIVMQHTSTHALEGDPVFMYPPSELETADDYINWKNEVSKDSPSLVPSYFHITKYQILTIQRDREWFAAVREPIKKTWEIIMRLQADKDSFLKYKESIHMIKSKDFYQKWNDTVCMIPEDMSECCFDEFEEQCMIASTE